MWEVTDLRVGASQSHCAFIPCNLSKFRYPAIYSGSEKFSSFKQGRIIVSRTISPSELTIETLIGIFVPGPS